MNYVTQLMGRGLSFALFQSIEGGGGGGGEVVKKKLCYLFINSQLVFFLKLRPNIFISKVNIYALIQFGKLVLSCKKLFKIDPRASDILMPKPECSKCCFSQDRSSVR